MAVSRSGDKPKEAFSALIKSSVGVLVVLGFAIVAYILSTRIDTFPMPGQLGPAFWPKMIIILLIVSCLIKVGELVAEWRKGFSSELTCAGQVNGARLAPIIATMLLCVLAIDTIGFALSNFCFIIVFLRLAGVRKPLSLILTSVLGTVGLLYLFVKVVYLPLPKGAWLFESVTLFVYRALGIM